VVGKVFYRACNGVRHSRFNPVIGIGKFFYDPDADPNANEKAWRYSMIFFQMSFATTTSTIVSGTVLD